MSRSLGGMRRRDDVVRSSETSLLFERRLLSLATALVVSGTVVWLIALISDFWIVVVPHTDTNWAHLGVWPLCNVTKDSLKNTWSAECTFNTELVRFDLLVCILVFLLNALATSFSIYSLRFPRYTVKRMTGALHLIVVMAILVLMDSVRTAARKVTDEQELYFGYAFLMAMVTMICHLAAALAFALGSKKHKHLPQDFEQILA